MCMSLWLWCISIDIRLYQMSIRYTQINLQITSIDFVGCKTTSIQKTIDTVHGYFELNWELLKKKKNLLKHCRFMGFQWDFYPGLNPCHPGTLRAVKAGGCQTHLAGLFERLGKHACETGSKTIWWFQIIELGRIANMVRTDLTW